MGVESLKWSFISGSRRFLFVRKTGRDREVIECQEEMERDPGEWDRAAVWDKVKEVENQAVWADPARQDQQVPAYARSVGTGNRINAGFPAWIGNVLSAELR
jgi:hypothetical protein